MSDSDFVRAKNVTIRLPNPESDEIYGIRKADWRLLRSWLESVPKKSKLWQTLYPICIGVSITSLLSWAGLFAVEDTARPLWLWFLYGYTCVFMGAAAVGCFWADKREEDRRQDYLQMVNDHMKTLEKQCEREASAASLDLGDTIRQIHAARKTFRTITMPPSGSAFGSGSAPGSSMDSGSANPE